MSRTLDTTRITYDEGLRETLCGWLRDLGLDPSRVPLNTEIVVDGDQVTLDYYAAVGAEGQGRLVSMTAEVVVAPITVPITHAVPERLS